MNKTPSILNEIEDHQVSSLIETFRESSGFDFSNYAPSSLRRRLLRFMEVKKIISVTELMELTRNDFQFAQEFLNEITVNVTEMFRDPSFWNYLKSEILTKLAVKDNLRIWHAACSTGEEVLSMAIMLDQAGLLDRTTILATDINLKALDDAKSGLIPWMRMKEYEANYKTLGFPKPLSDYYAIEKPGARFSKKLLDKIHFQKHDLVSCVSPDIFDIILGRNVFIYFNRFLQERVLKLFHESLGEKGILALGKMESIVSCKSASKFQTLSMEEKVFQKITRSI